MGSSWNEGLVLHNLFAVIYLSTYANKRKQPGAGAGAGGAGAGAGALAGAAGARAGAGDPLLGIFTLF